MDEATQLHVMLCSSSSVRELWSLVFLPVWLVMLATLVLLMTHV